VKKMVFGTRGLWLVAGLLVAPVAAASGQTPAPARAAANARDDAAKQSRYQVAQMERVLEGAVEHGVANIRDRLQTLGPTEMLISDNARARGFRLDGYGVFFDVVVPSFDTTVLWSIRTLDENQLDLQTAIKALQDHVKQAGDADLDQALRRVELQLGPLALASAAAPAPGARTVAGSVGSVRKDASPQAVDPILTNPNEAYRAEVTKALMDALLDHSGSLDVAPSEYLTIAARRNDDRPRLAPADSDAQTFVLRLKGSDLAAFLGRQISRDEALQRIEVRVF
jgi:hypothetical protein